MRGENAIFRVFNYRFDSRKEKGEIKGTGHRSTLNLESGSSDEK